MASVSLAMDTAFTYQGQLKGSDGVPLTATCDLTFALYDALNAGTQIGTVPQTGVTVTNGLFITNLDFGSSAFDGSARWLEISAKCGSDASYTTLSPRQELTPTPYAIHAGSAIFENYSGVVRNTGTHATDDFVFGSAQLANATGTADDARLFFDKSKGAFRAGRVEGTQWNDANVGLYSFAAGFDTIARGNLATVGGGFLNTASSDYTTISGGSANTASGDYATVAGGYMNTASNISATVTGGDGNTAAGEYSLAAGRRAKATNAGCFVWGDSTDADVTCNVENRWVARATGGVYFYTTAQLATGVYVSAGGGSWVTFSDRNAKEHFAPVNPQEVLVKVAALPIQTWNYKTQDPCIRHIGPVAQDFRAAFGLGENDTTISTVDPDGVALAAIQGLYQMVQERDATIAALQARMATLEQQQAQLIAQQATIDLLLQRLTALEQAAHTPVAQVDIRQ